MNEQMKPIGDQIQAYLGKWLSKYDKDEDWSDYAFDIMNMVLADIKASPEKYVEVCGCISDTGDGQGSLPYEKCPICNGKGLVPVVNKAKMKKNFLLNKRKF